MKLFCLILEYLICEPIHVIWTVLKNIMFLRSCN